MDTPRAYMSPKDPVAGSGRGVAHTFQTQGGAFLSLEYPSAGYVSWTPNLIQIQEKSLIV
jgi:hypothetical protein